MIENTILVYDSQIVMIIPLLFHPLFEAKKNPAKTGPVGADCFWGRRGVNLHFSQE